MEPTTQDRWPDTRRFTVDEVLQMVASGILDDDDHLELLDGELVPMNAQGPLHGALTVGIHRALERAFGPAFHIRDHSPVIAGPRNLPEPDLAVVRGSPLDYVARYPDAGDVALIVELAHTSHWRDRRKARIYAAAQFAHYWIVDLVERAIEVHRSPGTGGYEIVEVVRAGGEVEVPSPTPTRLAVAALVP